MILSAALTTLSPSSTKDTSVASKFYFPHHYNYLEYNPYILYNIIFFKSKRIYFKNVLNIPACKVAVFSNSTQARCVNVPARVAPYLSSN